VSPSSSGNKHAPRDPAAVPVTELSQVGEARRVAIALAAWQGFGETEAGQVALVVTEAATNLVKHARDGVILLRCVHERGTAGLEVLALDRGPGMADVGHCLRDGFSTAGTPGTGLGAIARLSGCADIHSVPGQGTALLVRLWAGPPPGPPEGLRVGAVSVPVAGEEVCGDAWAVEQADGRAVLLVADGLGHGPDAAAAAREAVRVFRDSAGLGPADILQAIHPALRSTRGAAVAVAEVRLREGAVRYAGVGNITGTVLSAGGDRSLVSHNGTLGHAARRFQEFAYPFPQGATLVMHSDGLSSRWDLDAYPGLHARDPALIAGVLYRDFRRGRDDATVLAASRAGGEAPS
jgi:anti-sigma regulatory factor (Ser/Thr protein kinase)